MHERCLRIVCGVGSFSLISASTTLNTRLCVANKSVTRRRGPTVAEIPGRGVLLRGQAPGPHTPAAGSSIRNPILDDRAMLATLKGSIHLNCLFSTLTMSFRLQSRCKSEVGDHNHWEGGQVLHLECSSCSLPNFHFQLLQRLATSTYSALPRSGSDWGMQSSGTLPGTPR